MSSDGGVATTVNAGPPATASPTATSLAFAPQPPAPIHEGIITPEAVVLELETAGIASRVFSGAIDALVQAVIFFVLLLVILLAASGGGGIDTDTQQAIAGALVFAVIFLYPVISEMAG